MSDPTSSLSPAAPQADQPADSLVYRPLSGFALASVIVAGVYAAALTILTMTAWYLRLPLFLNLWSLLMPMSAAILALSALRQIRRSEGTRAGRLLAVWGFWLSLVFGLCYGAYYFATYVAVKWKAKDFTENWLDKLHKGEFYAAFLDTVEPDQRSGDNPANKKRMMDRYGLGKGETKGPLLSFLECELVRQIKQGGSEATFQVLGVRSWSYQDRGYRVEQTFRLTTPEGVFDLLLVVQLSDDSRGPRRQVLWNGDQAIIDWSPTPLGGVINKWRKDAAGFVSDWLQKRTVSDRAGLFLDTRAPDERERLLRIYHARLALSHFSAGNGTATNAGPGIPLTQFAALIDSESAYLPNYREFVAGSLVQFEGAAPEKWQLEVPNDAPREEIFNDVKNIFRQDSQLQIMLSPEEKNYPLLVGDRLRITSNLTIYKPQIGRLTPRFTGKVRLVIESDPGALTDGRRPRWRVVSLDALRARVPSDAADAPAGAIPPPSAGQRSP